MLLVVTRICRSTALCGAGFYRKKKDSRQGGNRPEEKRGDTEKAKKGTVWEKADLNRPKQTWTAGALQCYDRIGRKEKNVAFRERMRAGFRHTGSRCSEE